MPNTLAHKRFKVVLILLFFFFTSQLTFGQMTGHVYDEDGTALSYASVSIKDTNRGVSTNENGFYTLSLDKGKHTIIFQYLGYKSQTVEVEIGEVIIAKDIILQREKYSLEGVTVRADAEDPAYEIIRKTIARRKYYNEHITNYEVDLYIKGVVKVLDAPDKILGMEVGDMDGMIDSSKQGIIYLSESKSTLFYKAPDQFKEIMYASKVAGDANGISFNQYQTARFNFYDSYIDFDRKLVSPIAANALRYYDYQLIGVSYDEDRLINKIKCIPKSDEGPFFSGLIYIAEDDWAIDRLDLSFSGKSIRSGFFDTISIKQIFQKSAKQEYLMLNQLISFTAGFMQFKTGGSFNYLFSDYTTGHLKEEDELFNRELFRIEEGASENTNNYWDSIRPVALTVEEKKDYVKKDSLEILWESKTFLDSVDAESNKFRLINILSGYTYRQSYKRRYWEIKNPTGTARFNSIEGFVLGLEGELRMRNADRNLYWKVAPNVSYGFGDKKWKADIKLERKFNSYNRSYISLEGGRRYQQFDQFLPLSNFGNSWITLFNGINYHKLYQEDYLKLNYRSELFNVFSTNSSVGYYDRSTPRNVTNYSFGDNIQNLLPNRPKSQLSEEAYELNNLIFNLSLSWNPSMQYLSLGDYKSRQYSNWPSISLNYKKGIELSDDFSDFDFLRLNFIDRDLSLNLLGNLSYNIEIGGFFNADKVHFSDYKHFHGNQAALLFRDRFLYTFKVLPYYEFSTVDNYFMTIIDHHFQGYLTDKVGILRKLQLKMLLGAAYFYTPDNQYTEFSLGLEDIGIGSLKLFRFDYAVGFSNHGDLYHGPMLTLTLGL